MPPAPRSPKDLRSSFQLTPGLRRTLAISAVVLATGGLVLHRSSASTVVGPGKPVATLRAQGLNSASFSGPGAHGTIALSHRYVHAASETPLFGEVRFVADKADGARERAPISLAVVLDTSGSMEGEKIEEAKRSVLRLLDSMRDSDEIAFVRYSDSSHLVQSLAPVGEVRSSLSSRIRELDAAGGTNIPSGIARGLSALEGARSGRVKRVVLVSDGLDSTRAKAEALAKDGFARGVTVSSLGIGLDFDEGYMGAVAQVGHGNFAFVKDGASLAKFLTRELDEASSTTVENAKVRLRLPSGARFVAATGADATVSGDEVVLSLGSLFAGDERRVILEMVGPQREADAPLSFEARASWRRVGAACTNGDCDTTTSDATSLTVVATTDPGKVQAGQDGAVLASAVSVIASKRQMEAAKAYADGDVQRAQRLVEQNQASLGSAMAQAPAAMATSLASQMKDYEDTKQTFAKVAPRAAEGRAAAKSAAAKEMKNLSREAW